MTQEILGQLGRLAQIKADRDLAALARLSGHIRQAAREARALETTAAPALRSGSPDAALCGGAYARWEALREERLMLLQAERARLAVEFKAAQDAARISFGRAEVLETLRRRENG